MSNQTYPCPISITDDAIRDILYRMAAHVSFFAEPRTVDLKAAAFADALVSVVRPPVQKAEPPADTPHGVDGVFIPSADYAFLSKGFRDLDSALNGFSRFDRDLCGELISQLRDILPTVSKPSPDLDACGLTHIDELRTALEARGDKGIRAFRDYTTVGQIIADAKL